MSDNDEVPEVEEDPEEETSEDESDIDSELSCLSPSNKRHSSGSVRGLSVDNSSKVGATENIAESSTSSDLESIEEESHTNNGFFFHIAFTPTECTVICTTDVMAELFTQPITAAKELGYIGVKLLDDTFVILQVDSDGGFDNGMRILELTRPLSQNNIPLFFLLTHFTDIVLIPSKYKEKVETLDGKTNTEDSDDLATRAFQVFHEVGVKPKLNKLVRLLLTGARLGQVQNSILKTSKVLLCSKSIPCYFAVTRTAANEISLILPKLNRERAAMGFNADNIIGLTQDTIVPITIDFAKMPLDCTGIVAGVASKLFNGIVKGNHEDHLYEMSYLSMATSGLIMIPRENVKLINRILNEPIEKENK